MWYVTLECNILWFEWCKLVHVQAEKVAYSHLKDDHIVKLWGYAEDKDKLVLVLDLLPVRLEDLFDGNLYVCLLHIRLWVFVIFMKLMWIILGLDWDHSLEILLESAAALKSIHEQGYVFSDFKVENVMFDKVRNQWFVKYLSAYTSFRTNFELTLSLFRRGTT